MTNLSIVIPCYNEAENVSLLFNQLLDLSKQRQNIEILLVDNGSTDQSTDFLEDAFAKLDNDAFKLIRIEKNQGYGHGILAGLETARGEVLSWTHADLQTDPSDVLVAYDLYCQSGGGDTVVKGKRKNRRLSEAFFTWGSQRLAQFVLREKLDDINAQPKLFSRAFYQRFIKDKAPHDFSLDLFLLYQAARHASSIKEIPVDFAKRRYGQAKGGGSWKTKFNLIRRTTAYIFKLRKQLM